jgi:predicted nuclease with TOPRIM domain
MIDRKLPEGTIFRSGDDEIIDTALDTLVWQRKERERLTARVAELETRYEKSQDQIDRLIAENARIRERLNWICAVMDLDDAVSLQWVYAELEALGDKQ